MIDTQATLYAALTAAVVCYSWNRIRRPKIRHPPSPWSLPFLGNLFSIPPGYEYISFAKLGQQLKCIHSMDDSQGVDPNADLSEFASNRLRRMNWPEIFALMEYTDTWRHYRRMMNNWLNVRAVTQFNDLQERQARSLLKRIMRVAGHPEPFDQLKEEIYFALGSTMFQLAYGYRPETPQDRFLKAFQLTLHNLSCAVMQTNFLVNVFPIMVYIPNWFPGAGWRATARKYAVQKEESKSEPYEWAKSQVGKGTHQVSILGSLLQDHQLLSGLSPAKQEEMLKEIGITIVGGQCI
ncbi:cytochrome P450 domain-containing protein [Rhizoctonia solani AG-1 IA]|uniref:Cytochrome P450 domain-containing protein n=1 Tax=Thanatephorus cucumeris (strain AG1-IA) TaxID=983506 RepID=L8WKM7_THACA|nr:cytochrome P450 domain-containing protein [Rhizoctonia solani AG-1 IA]